MYFYLNPLLRLVYCKYDVTFAILQYFYSHQSFNIIFILLVEILNLISGSCSCCQNQIHLQLYVFKVDSVFDSLYYYHPNNLIKCQLPSHFIREKQNPFFKYGRRKVQL